MPTYANGRGDPCGIGSGTSDKELFHKKGLLHEVVNFVQQPFLCAPSTACAVPLPRDNGEGLG